MKNTILITSLAVTFGLSINAAAQSSAAQQGAPTVKTGSALKAKAASPAPSATAKNTSQKTTIGKVKTSAKASAPSSYWTEEVDVHDDGSVETTEFLYDAQRGVVYAYGEDDFTCANGKPEKAGILEAVFAAGNKAGKPVRSGYYIVGLNAGRRNRSELRADRSCRDLSFGFTPSEARIRRKYAEPCTKTPVERKIHTKGNKNFEV